MKEFITSLNKEELVALFKESLKDLLEDNSRPNENEDELLSFPEVCEYLKLSRGSVYKLINNKVLRSFKLSGKRKFLKSEVLSSIQNLQDQNSKL